MSTGDRSKLLIVLLLLLISALFAFALRQRPIRDLPPPTLYTNKVGTLYAGVQLPPDLQLPFVVITNMNLSGTTLLLRPDGWLEESWVQSLKWNSSTGYAAIAAVPWDRWKLQLRAIHYRQFRFGPFKVNLAPQTNLWISAELPPRKELREKSNLIAFPLPTQ